MKNSLCLQPEFDQVITEAVDDYMQEVRRIKRLQMRTAITQAHQQAGLPVPEGEAMETHIDVMEALCQAGHNDPDRIQQLMSEFTLSPDGKFSSDQILQHLEPYLVEPEPLVTNADLDRYRFEVTGKISTKCTICRRGRRWTQQEFMLRHNAFLRRVLIGDTERCPFCHIGHIKVYGVKAVRRDPADGPVPSNGVTSADAALTDQEGASNA